MRALKMGILILKAIRTGGDIFMELAAIWLEKPVSRIQVFIHL